MVKKYYYEFKNDKLVGVFVFNLAPDHYEHIKIIECIDRMNLLARCKVWHSEYSNLHLLFLLSAPLRLRADMIDSKHKWKPNEIFYETRIEAVRQSNAHDCDPLAPKPTKQSKNIGRVS